MRWMILSIAALLMWGAYPIFGNRATMVHGAKITMLFEGIGMIILALGVNGVRPDLSTTTLKSAGYATAMAVLSAGGIMFQFRSMQEAPTKTGIITLITGAFPMLTYVGVVVLGEQALTIKGAAGVACMIVGLALVSM